MLFQVGRNWNTSYWNIKFSPSSGVGGRQGCFTRKYSFLYRKREKIIIIANFIADIVLTFSNFSI